MAKERIVKASGKLEWRSEFYDSWWEKSSPAGWYLDGERIDNALLLDTFDERNVEITITLKEEE